MRKDIVEKKKYLMSEQAAKDLRIAAYSGMDENGVRKCILLRIAGDRIDKVDIYAPDDIECGDVYMGVILNSNPNISASFADIGRGDPVFVSGVYKGGTILPLVVKTLAFREKLTKVSAKIPQGIAEEVSAKALHAVKGSCIYKADGVFENSIKLVCDTPGAKWITEDESLYKRAYELASDKDKIVLHKDENVSLCALYGLSSKLSRILSPRVNLRSGAEIVITETEAMCVIDVNTAKALTGKDKEETFFKINMEAVSEIATQISARNLSGIIMVDLINMRSKESETILTAFLEESLKALTPPARLEDITKLGIAEISRKRLKGSIYSEKAFLNSTILIK